MRARSGPFLKISSVSPEVELVLEAGFCSQAPAGPAAQIAAVGIHVTDSARRYRGLWIGVRLPLIVLMTIGRPHAHPRAVHTIVCLHVLRIACPGRVPS